VSPHAYRLLAAMAAAGIVSASLVHSPIANAFDFGNMMNPSKWLGGGRDHYDDYYDGPYGGPWDGPYRGGPFDGGPWGGPWGWNGPGPYGGGPYGSPGAYPGVPAYGGAPQRVPAAPAAKAPSPPQASTSSNEIDELKRRIEELESQQKAVMQPSGEWDSAPSSPSSHDWEAAPAFRPMGKY
jgi:hypothetical protein